MYAVTGATGQLGRLVIAALKDRGAGNQTVALARDPAKATDLGVEVRAFDYDAPETLVPALEGIDKLLLISGSEVGKRVAQHKNIIEAAKGAGVRQIAYTSILHADTSPISLAPEHRETELLLEGSGLETVFLRNTWYTENYTGNLGPAIENGAIIGSTGDGELTTASRKDLAEAAAIVLTSDGHDGKVYELANDQAFTMAELAQEVSSQTGKPVTYSYLDKDTYAGVLTEIGLPAPVAELLASSDDHASRGALYDDSKALSTLLGRPTQSVSEAVAEALKG